MSDYLWDKTGARDAEVERLESLLGELRHRPRPFAPPDEATAARARAGAQVLSARRHFRTQWLAAAAMLLLALVALAFALLRTGATGGGVQPASQARREDSLRAGQQNVAPTLAPTPQVAATITHEKDKNDVRDAAAVSVARGDLNERQAALRERRAAFVAKREQAQPPRIAAANADGRDVKSAAQSSSHDDISLKMRLAAKEQLVYALRLTSSKLSEVRAKTQALGDAKQSFVEGDRIR
ncbi:MAG TPA: hypothetical protein VLJ61_12300 [Pyrinomonadaceae bacterium]|nr:hypothetical protein [Pyrinomonadaceae bacterium]